MPRTTLMIEEVLFRQLKQRAAEQGLSFQSVANDALRQGLAPAPAVPYKLRWHTSPGGLAPGLSWDDLANREVLFDIFDGRR
ncbi:MAG: hypothetical protein ACRD2F_03320 [Terriglobales bacterium]